MSLPQTPDELRGLCVDAVGMILLKAAEIMRERGHCKRALELQDGSVCLRGAIITAVYGGTGSFRMSVTTLTEDRLLSAADVRCEKYLGRDPVSWNNAPERTADEVIEALQAAAFASTP